MDQKTVVRAARYLAHWIRPFRSWILRAGKVLGRWVAIAAVISAVVSFVLDGTEFVDKKIPAATAFVSKSIFLRERFRPTLVERIVKADPAYANLCMERSQVLDLDNDGDATDLLIVLFPRSEQSKCPGANETADTTYVILKEVAWRDLWPRFEVVRTITRSDIGSFALGSGYQMTFQQLGPFLFGSIYGTDFPGYAVYGYANGALQSLGKYRPVGSLIENPQSEPRAQIGNRLILYAEEGMKSFELAPDGRFSTRSLAAHEIVEINNAALVIEDSERISPELVEKTKEVKPANRVRPRARRVKGGQDRRVAEPVNGASSIGTPATAERYKLSDNRHKDCSSVVFMNGTQIALKPAGEPAKTCGAEIAVSPGTVIVANIACEYQGFLTTKHFPWGRVYDPAQSTHTISCPSDGDNEDSSFKYVLMIKLQ